MLKHFTFYPPFLSCVISVVSKLKKCDLKSIDVWWNAVSFPQPLTILKMQVYHLCSDCTVFFSRVVSSTLVEVNTSRWSIFIKQHLAFLKAVAQGVSGGENAPL